MNDYRVGPLSSENRDSSSSLVLRRTPLDSGIPHQPLGTLRLSFSERPHYVIYYDSNGCPQIVSPSVIYAT